MLLPLPLLFFFTLLLPLPLLLELFPLELLPLLLDLLAVLLVVLVLLVLLLLLVPVLPLLPVAVAPAPAPLKKSLAALATASTPSRSPPSFAVVVDVLVVVVVVAAWGVGLGTVLLGVIGTPSDDVVVWETEATWSLSEPLSSERTTSIETEADRTEARAEPPIHMQRVCYMVCVCERENSYRMCMLENDGLTDGPFFTSGVSGLSG